MRSSTIPVLTVAMVFLAATTSLGAQQTTSLFDGKSLDGWTTVGGQPVTKGWEVVDGMIHLNTDGERAGPIVTEREFRDFELRFEWKNVPGGNSGVKYRVRKFADVPGFGRNRAGKIMLTEHKSEVWYRNIELTRLVAPEVCQPKHTPRGKRRGILGRIRRPGR